MSIIWCFKFIKKNELIISRLSISNYNKKYVICYNNLTYNPKNKILKVDPRILFNQTFLIDGKKHSLSRYVDGDVEGFIKYYSEKTRKECEEIIKSNLKNGEILDSMPDIMILERDIPINLSDTYKIIEEQYDNGTLSSPLKAFLAIISAIVIEQKNHQFLYMTIGLILIKWELFITL